MDSERIQTIDLQLLDQTTKNAKSAERKRINFNFHQPQDTLQRFLNAIEPDSYIRPHRHTNPLREEIFLVLRGTGAVIIFDDDGEVEKINLLDQNLGYWGVDIPGGPYHAIVSCETGSVFYELKEGPYNPNTAKEFAPWSPPEDTPEAKEFLSNLQKSIAEFKRSLK